MNSINLTGNICNALELKSTQSGKSVITFNLAVKRPFTKDTTDFIPMVAWEKNAEYLSRYGKKGSRVAVSGKLTTRKYQDKDGNNRTAYEVVCDNVELMDSKNDAQGTFDTMGYQEPTPTFTKPVEPNFEAVDIESDLPF
jgi:single-strand DNA-binding protein